MSAALLRPLTIERNLLFDNSLQSTVALLAGTGGFDVEDDVTGFEEGCDVEVFEFAVGDGGYGGVEFFAGGKFVDYGEAVLALDGGGVGPGIVDSDVEIIFFESLDDVDDLGVAHVGAILLECEAKDEDVAVEHLNALFKHEFDDAVGYISAHAVVHAASCEDNLGIVAIALGTLGEVIGVDADAVAPDESGLEGKEVPFGRSSLENVGCVDAHECEDFRKLVDESDVDVALRVFDDLGGFGYFDRGGEVSAGGDDAAVDVVDEAANLGGRA